MFEIIGFQNINFIEKESGQVISGVKFHLKGDPIDYNGEGNTVVSKFFPDNRIIGVPHVEAMCEFKFTITSKGEAKVTGIKII